MPLRRLLILAFTGSLLASLVPSRTTAQEETQDETPDATKDDAPVDPDEVHPPVLVDFVYAPYPPEAAAERLEGIVVLKLSIDAEGAVTGVEVDAPAGHGFDEAAMDAARQFRFEPARRGASPVAARILYSYEFTLPPEGAVTGTVLVPDTTSDEVVVGALISLQGPDQQRYSVRTDSEGKFRIDSLPPGPYLLQAQAEGIGRVEADVIVADDQVTETTLRLLGDSDQNPIEVTVWGTTDVERLRRSAQAVQVVELDNAQREASDLGEVLARTEGVGVRRAGGIGSPTTIQLNGLTGDQIRFFLDGIPLELSGYPTGAANVPLNLLERADVYRGVVPIQFGADALGGAINLVTEQDLTGTRGLISYAGGSFDTQRVALAVRHRHDRTGFFTRATGFFDLTRNDYRVLVDVPDDVGRLTEETVYRFHDAYQAGGGSLELGVVDVKWADRFIARGFATGFENQIQHNIVMEVPYGEVLDQGFTAGGSLRYENAFSDRFATSLVAGYTFNRREFLDAATCVYDWFGQCIRERPIAGEIQPFPRDQVTEDNTAFGRLNFAWRIRPEHTVRLTVAPTYVTRSGRDRLIPPDALDPLTARRDLTTNVSGLEYELNLVDNKLQNIVFVKNYLQFMRSEEPLPGGALRGVDRSTNRFGAGNGFRYLFTDWTYFKVSYEYATRLPRPEEVFGDGALIQDNLELQPEVSHNVNLQYTVDYRDTRSGAWRVDTNAFLREVDQLIVLLGNDQFFSYQNLFSARSVGIEGSAGWTMRDEWLSIDANATYQSVRNTSGDGTFGDFKGDRIPNQPYLFANGITRFQAKEIGSRNDVFTMVWYLRYVHDFFRTWESAGLREFKQVVPSQFLNTVAVTYILRARKTSLSFTAQVENIGDQRAFDFFGVQRPGRGFFFVVRADLFTPTDGDKSNE